MNEIMSLLSGGWSWVLGGLAIIVGLAGSYFGGKKNWQNAGEGQGGCCGGAAANPTG